MAGKLQMCACNAYVENGPHMLLKYWRCNSADNVKQWEERRPKIMEIMVLQQVIELAI